MGWQSAGQSGLAGLTRATAAQQAAWQGLNSPGRASWPGRVVQFDHL